jgi:serine O-acetyltransferase
VIDPEIGINVVDLGLIKEIAANGHGVKVRMVLTSPTCPLAGYLVEQVRRQVRSVTNGNAVEVVLVDEGWSWDDTAAHLLWGDGI